MSVESITSPETTHPVEKIDMPKGFDTLTAKVATHIDDMESIGTEWFWELSAFLSIGDNTEDSHIDIALNTFFKEQLG